MALVETDNLLHSMLNGAAIIPQRFSFFPTQKIDFEIHYKKKNKSYLKFTAQSFRIIAGNYIL